MACRQQHIQTVICVSETFLVPTALHDSYGLRGPDLFGASAPDGRQRTPHFRAGGRTAVDPGWPHGHLAWSCGHPVPLAATRRPRAHGVLSAERSATSARETRAMPHWLFGQRSACQCHPQHVQAGQRRAPHWQARSPSTGRASDAGAARALRPPPSCCQQRAAVPRVVRDTELPACVRTWGGPSLLL